MCKGDGYNAGWLNCRRRERDITVGPVGQRTKGGRGRGSGLMEGRMGHQREGAGKMGVGSETEIMGRVQFLRMTKSGGTLGAGD